MEVRITVQNMDLYAKSNRSCEYRCKGLSRCDYATETYDGPMNRGCGFMWRPRRYSVPEAKDFPAFE